MKSRFSHCTTLKKKQNRCTVKQLCSYRRVRNLNVIFLIFPANKFYSISSRWEETRVNDAQNVCCASTLCCPCTTDPSSWYATCHFLRAGEYSSNTGGYLDESEATRRGMITSTHTVHTRLLKNTHARTKIFLPCTEILCTPCLLTAGQCLVSIYKHVGTRSLLRLKHAALPKTNWYHDPLVTWTKTKARRPAKTFPTQLILKRSPGRSNFRFATQLLQIQSSFWLSGWLAAPPNKAPIVWNL